MITDLKNCPPFTVYIIAEHLLETRIDGHTQIGPLLGGKSSQLVKHHDQVSSHIQLSYGDNFLEGESLSKCTHDLRGCRMHMRAPKTTSPEC